MATFKQWQQSTRAAIVHGLDDGLALPDVAVPVFEDSLHELYHALVDVLTPAEPRSVTQQSEVSALMMQWGAPDIGRELGRGVQRYRNAAKAGAVAELRAALLSIERERVGGPAHELAEVA